MPCEGSVNAGIDIIDVFDQDGIRYTWQNIISFHLIFAGLKGAHTIAAELMPAEESGAAIKILDMLDALAEPHAKILGAAFDIA